MRGGRAPQVQREARQATGASRRRPAVLVGLLVAAVVVALGYAVPLPWTGLPTRRVAGQALPYKTVWDWAQLLLVPATLAALGFWLGHRETDRAVADEQARADVLQAYQDRMSDLVLDRELAGSAARPEALMVARARTLTCLHRLDGTGRALVLQFLYESGLIGSWTADGRRRDAALDLRGAQLRGLRSDDLRLSGADLRGADLEHADLAGARLDHAVLRGARLRHAELGEGALLADADLAHADLTEATVSADLRGAVLDEAILERTNLLGAAVSDEQLLSARTLEGATLPDGSRALAPQTLYATSDTVVQDGTGDPIGIRVTARARATVLRTSGAADEVGVLLRLDHTVDDGGRSDTGRQRGTSYVSFPHDALPLLLNVSRESEATVALELPLTTAQPVVYLRLHCHLGLDGQGQLRLRTVPGGLVTDEAST